MRNYLSKWLLFCAGTVLFSSCATIITGTNQRIDIISNEPGAQVYLNHRFTDSTPCTIKVKRSWDETPRIEVSKEGYKTETVVLNKKMNEIVILNFINIFGWALDGAMAACIKFEQPDTIQLTPWKKTQ